MKQKKYIVTTDKWFYGRDGQRYNAAWGTIKNVSEDSIVSDVLSYKNLLQVGEGDKACYINRMHVDFIARCDERPNDADCDEASHHEGVIRVSKRQIPMIYITE